MADIIQFPKYGDPFWSDEWMERGIAFVNKELDEHRMIRMGEYEEDETLMVKLAITPEEDAWMEKEATGEVGLVWSAMEYLGTQPGYKKVVLGPLWPDNPPGFTDVNDFTLQRVSNH